MATFTATPTDRAAYLVSPQSGRNETLFVAGATLLVIVVATLFALTRPEISRIEGLADWQLSAFDDLGPVDRTLHSALLATTEEITLVQQDYAQWLTIEDLEEGFYPPFAQDAFWQANGSLQWELHHPVGELENSQGVTHYFGHSGQVEGQGAWLIVQRHSHAGFNAITEPELWLHPDTDIARPQEFRQDSLIRNGWRQVIAYRGADEADRIR